RTHAFAAPPSPARTRRRPRQKVLEAEGAQVPPTSPPAQVRRGRSRQGGLDAGPSGQLPRSSAASSLPSRMRLPAFADTPGRKLTKAQILVKAGGQHADGLQIEPSWRGSLP